MDKTLTFSLILISASFGLLAWFIHQRLQNMQKQMNDETKLEDLVNRIFGKSAQVIAEQSKHILTGEKEVIQTDLANKQRSIEQLVVNLQKEIANRQEEIRGLEKDRTKMFSALEQSLLEHKEVTKDLKATTDALSRVLSNNQQRGAWGERIIEDLLRSVGLVEGVHFKKQLQLGSTAIRPDITLLLPNQRVVPIDVKFPYAAIQKLAASESKHERLEHHKQFASDIRVKIKKVAEYILPEENTLDYALLFVPNEMVFSYLNQHFPEIIDEAMAQRVMLVSPFSFLIVARTVMESYRNFMMENNLREIVKQIGQFTEEWQRFVQEFNQFGETLVKLDNVYQKITQTRYKRMNLRMQRIGESQGKPERILLP